MIINDLDDYYIVFDTKNRNTELDTLLVYNPETSSRVTLALLGIGFQPNLLVYL